MNKHISNILILSYWLTALFNSIKSIDLFEMQTYILVCISIIVNIVNDRKLNNQHLWICFTYALYLFIPTTIYLYIPITSFLSAVAYRLHKRVEISYLPHNKENLCIAFYRGTNKKFFGRITALLELDITSVDVLYNDTIWRYKKGKLVESKFDRTSDYVYYDTGVRCEDLKDKFSEIRNIKYYKKWYKSNCVGILKPLLVELGFYPKDYLGKIPSVYFRRIICG